MKVVFLAVSLVISFATGGMTSESISNFTKAPFLLECRIPDYSMSGAVNVSLTQEEREQLPTEGRCFSACTSAFSNEVTHLTMHSIRLVMVEH